MVILGSLPIRTLLVNPLSGMGMRESLKSREACRSQFIPIKPCDHTNQMNGSSNPKMLQMRFCKAKISGAAHAKGTDPL